MRASSLPQRILQDNLLKNKWGNPERLSSALVNFQDKAKNAGLIPLGHQRNILGEIKLRLDELLRR
jgi:hypothetical protein